MPGQGKAWLEVIDYKALEMRDLFLKFVKTIKDFEIGTMFSKFSLLFKLKK